jgi:hypothetical protein
MRPNPDYNDTVEERQGPLQYIAALTVHDILSDTQYEDTSNLARTHPDAARNLMSEFCDFMRVPPAPEMSPVGDVQRFMLAITQVTARDYAEFFGL